MAGKRDKRMNRNSQTKRSRIPWLEILILFVGVIWSAVGTASTFEYSNDYIWCLGFVALGLAFIMMLIFIRKSWMEIVGLGLILIYMVTAGLGYMFCVVYRTRMHRLYQYRDKEVVVNVSGDRYVWDHESYEIGMKDKKKVGNAQVIIDGKEVSFEVFASGDHEYVYVEYFSDAAEEYMKLDLVEE